MNDKKIVEDILETEKNLVANMATALNEASCSETYDSYHDIFDSVTSAQKNLFTLAFNKSWYKLEAAECNKICQEYKKLKKELDEC